MNCLNFIDTRVYNAGCIYASLNDTIPYHLRSSEFIHIHLTNLILSANIVDIRKAQNPAKQTAPRSYNLHNIFQQTQNNQNGTECFEYSHSYDCSRKRYCGGLCNNCTREDRVSHAYSWDDPTVHHYNTTYHGWRGNAVMVSACSWNRGWGCWCNVNVGHGFRARRILVARRGSGRKRALALLAVTWG